MAVVTQSEQSIVGEINAHVQQSGLPNSSWYVGVTSNVDERLFGYHRVPRQNHWFIWRRAINHVAARNIEAAYHRAGCKGSGGGGDHSAVIVYAYVITNYTVE